MSNLRSPAYLNEMEAAQYLGVSVKSLRRWRFDRRGPTYAKIGGKLIRYPLTNLDDWVSLQMVSHD
jgi:predicted DNA-binding transcriptional regulator AlpA